MMNDNFRERRKQMNVTDKLTERGVMINNILQALVLGVMAWVAWSINEIRADISEIQTKAAVGANDIEHLEKALEEHVRDNSRHWHFGQNNMGSKP